MNALQLTGLLGLALSVACGATSMTPGGGGTDAGSGGGGQQRLPIASVGTLTNPQERDADFSCHGMRSKPTSTAAAAAFELEVKDFEDDFHTEGLRVQVFSTNEIDAACSPPSCVEGMTNANGKLMGMGVRGTWFAYRVFGRGGATPETTVVGSVQFNETVPAAGRSVDGISVSAKTLDLIPTVLGFGRAPNTAIVAGRQQDCKGDDVFGLRMRLLDNGVEIPEGAKQSEPHYRYFDGDSFPSATQPHTHVDGLFAAANIPINGASRAVTVELHGRRAGDAEPVLLGREHIRVFPDTVTVINLGPLRREELR